MLVNATPLFVIYHLQCQFLSSARHCWTARGMETLQLIFAIYWPIFYFICLFLHTTMLFLIYHRVTRILATLRFFLYAATIVNFAVATLAFATQVRNVNNPISMALLCNGFCKFIGPSSCFNCYSFFLALITTSGFINLHTLCYRTMVLKHLDQPKSFRATTKFSLHYVVPLVFLILTYIPAQNHATVFEETQANHADYDLEMYQLFGGFADSHHFCMTFNTILLAISTVYGPIMGAVWKRYALKVLLSNTMSHPSRVMLETLIKGLSLQILLPLCCYVPIAFLYIWNKYSGTQILISQFTIPFLGSLPCILDPCLQIYFIMPYRTAIKRLLTCRPASPRASSSQPREEEFHSMFQVFRRFIGHEREKERSQEKKITHGDNAQNVTMR